jgi:hypothetical protein
LDFAGRQREALLASPPRKVNRPRYFWPKLSDVKRVATTLREYYITRLRRAPDDNAPVEEWFRYDIVRDSEIDIWFYSAGGLTALAMYSAPGLAIVPLLTFVAVLIVSALASRDWLWANIAFDRASLPFVSRFALNGRPAEVEIRKNALAFAIGSNTATGHLVIIGPPKSGRTTTAVALGVEALLQQLPPRDVVVYTTLCKLLDRVAEEQMILAEDKSGPPGERPVWPPKDAELLIVDDVGAQGAKIPLLSPEVLEKELLNNELLRNTCNGKRVIWVVGDDPGRSQEWINVLRTAFTKEGSVKPCVEPPVELRTVIPRQERLPPSQQAA